MIKLFIAVFSLTLALGLSIGDADAAKRLGGGKSVGMQREAVAPKPAAPAQAAPAQAAPASDPWGSSDNSGSSFGSFGASQSFGGSSEFGGDSDEPEF